MDDNMDTIWLYLEPYIFISEDEAGYLFYNTKDKKGVTFVKSPSICKVVKHLQNIDQLYSIKLRVDDLHDLSLFEFVKTIQEYGFGDLIDGKEEKPLLMPPLLNLQRDVNRLKDQKSSLDNNILSYLNEVVIYLNDVCANEKKHCKQLPHYLQSLPDLHIERLNNFLRSMAFTGATISFVGGDVFSDLKIQEMLRLVSTFDGRHTVIANWNTIPEDSTFIMRFARLGLRIRVVVDTDCNEIIVNSIVNRLKNCGVVSEWEMNVASLRDYRHADILSELLKKFDLELDIKPVYNGDNYAFFEQYVFTTEKDLNSIELDRQSIFARQVLNTNDFGKLIVLSDGTVYANLYDKPLGNISDSLKNLILYELDHGTSWRRTRYDVYPCKFCRYRLLCPSPSNYELALGKFNLCHIKE